MNFLHPHRDAFLDPKGKCSSKHWRYLHEMGQREHFDIKHHNDPIYLRTRFSGSSFDAHLNRSKDVVNMHLVGLPFCEWKLIFVFQIPPLVNWMVGARKR